ncbi:unnamed protein product [Calypogeia fissa]
MLQHRFFDSPRLHLQRSKRSLKAVGAKVRASLDASEFVQRVRDGLSSLSANMQAKNSASKVFLRQKLQEMRKVKKILKLTLRLQKLGS